MSEQSDFSCTDLPPPKDIIYSVPPIHLYPLNYDNDNTLSRGKGIPLKGRKLDWKGYRSPPIHPYRFFSISISQWSAQGSWLQAGHDDEEESPGRVPAFGAAIPELRDVNSFTQSNTFKLNFTPRKKCELRQFWHFDWTKRISLGEQMLIFSVKLG